VTTPADSNAALVESGKQYVAHHGCAGCHQGDAASGTLSGRPTPLPGSTVYGPNLTPDKDTGLGGWTDAQILGAIKNGTDDEGASLCPQMPRFADLTAADGKAVVAYLRSLTAVTLEIPGSECGQDGTTTSQGKRVVDASGCAGCHSPSSGDELSGNDTALPGTRAYAPNLTPDMDTGIGGWADDDIIRGIRTGVDDDGATLCASMPRFSKLSDDDAKAVVTYLRSLKATRHTVPDSECAERPPEAPDAGTPPDDAGTSTAPDAGQSVDAGQSADAGLPDAGQPDAGHGTPDAGQTSPDAGGVIPLPTPGPKGTWTTVTAGVALPPAWLADIADLSTYSPSVEARSYVGARIQVKTPMLGTDYPCPLPYDTLFYSACDGFTAIGYAGDAVIDTYVYLGSTPACLNALPPLRLAGAVGVWDTHYDSASQVTSYVIAATTCADLGLGAAPVQGTNVPLDSTDIARTLTPFPKPGALISVRGVVTAQHLTSTSYSFSLEDPRGGPHSGAIVVKHKKTGYSLGNPPAIGDYVQVNGTATITSTGRNELDL
jgi:mono/diheme cytochrome c family protein